MDVAFRNLQYLNFGCGGHMIQLAVHGESKIAEEKTFMTHSRKIVAFFYRFTLTEESLNQDQESTDAN